MPGIFGSIGTQITDNSISLTKMAQSLHTGNRFHTDFYEDNLVGLGRISLGISNPEKQPIWNEEHTICTVMEGELYDYRSMKNELLTNGHIFTVNNDVEFLLHLYEEKGDDFALYLNGAFIAAIWDSQTQRLLIVNDRMGLYPLYYALLKNRFIFGSGVRALMTDPDLSRKIDQIAIAEFLTFDHVLGDRTFLESVRLLPQASILTFHQQKLNIRQYWKLSYPQCYPLIDETDYVDRLLQLLEQAVIRQTSHDDQDAGILLSGGLDSRILTTYLTANTKKTPIHSFTFGIPGCDDARYAEEVSRITGSTHHFFELLPDWLPDKADEAVRITDGMGNLTNLHAIATIEKETTFVNVLYKGFLGDAMMGFGITHHLLANYDEDIAINAHLEAHRARGVIIFDLDEQKNLFTDPFKRNIGTGIIDEYSAGMKASGVESLADQRNYFDFFHRVPRMTIKGIEVVRERAMVRLPFCDNDLIEFSLIIPPGLRYGRKLIKDAFISEFPKLSQVPITETGLPMIACKRDIVIRSLKLIHGHLHSAGLKKASYISRRPYADYNTWFRTNLRTWVEDILLNKRIFERGYFNPDYLRSLVLDHFSGKNYANKLGQLITIELWHRQTFD